TTAISFDTEDHPGRLAADGWHVQKLGDSEDLDGLERALEEARAETERPSFIAVRSHIAYPAPHAADTAKPHGAPPGRGEVGATKKVRGFDPDRSFWVDDRVYGHMSGREAGAGAQANWKEQFEAWGKALPELLSDWDRTWSGRLEEGWQESLPSFAAAER